MAAGEFELIEALFGALPGREDLLLGIGDDAALVRVDGPAVLATDTLVAGVHFAADAPADAVGHKALAVNLSDLAAMGARPRFALLALTLPDTRSSWARDFARGFLALAREHEVLLAGGDTTRGPLSMTVTVVGDLCEAPALTRAGARPGHQLWVSGTLGDARLGLEVPAGATGPAGVLCKRLQWPTPRVALGRALAGIASAAIDLSDGLGQDLGHVLAASGVGARLDTDQLPLSAAAIAHAGREVALAAALAGGDDFELLFTAAKDQAASIEALATPDCSLRCIGEIVADAAVTFTGWATGRSISEFAGWDHFARD